MLKTWDLSRTKLMLQGWEAGGRKLLALYNDETSMPVAGSEVDSSVWARTEHFHGDTPRRMEEITYELFEFEPGERGEIVRGHRACETELAIYHT